MFTLIMTLLTFSALFAQRNKQYDDDRNVPVYNNGQYGENDLNRRPDHGIEMQRDNGRWQKDEPKNKQDWHERTKGEYEDGNRQIADYRNDTRRNGWKRERPSDQFRRQSGDKLKAFGGGILLGGVLGVIISSQR